MDVERFDWSMQSDAVKTHHVDAAAFQRLGEFSIQSTVNIILAKICRI